MTPREIKFEDIRKGDDIEARRVVDGVTCTRRGIAHATSSRVERWYTEAWGLIATDYDGDWKFYLHHRPAPAEPKGLGAVVRAKVSRPTSDPHSVRTFVRTAGRDLPWVDEWGFSWAWSHLNPDSIEVES